MIFSGKKTVELRRKRPKLMQGGDWVIVYVSSPVKALVGAFQIEDVHEGEVGQLWEMLWEKAGITKEQFDSYYSGTNKGIGIGVRSVAKLKTPLGLSQLRQRISHFRPPQSFCYLSPAHLKVVGLHDVVVTG